MANTRRSYAQAEELALTTQVGGYCPLCDTSLFYEKKGRSYKAFELAHIYPLNPKLDELTELKDVKLLHPDVNHPDNIVPLCTPCHTRFDKPRTSQEYEQLASIKRKLIEKAFQRALHDEYPLEVDIARIITRLNDVTVSDDSVPLLELAAKNVDLKFNETMPMPTRRKIKHAIADYYPYIQGEFRELEFHTPVAAELIYAQVRLFYLKQKSLGLPQSTVFSNVVEWLVHTTSPATSEAAEIVASFFVQNCEVFE
jgi:hypothetical protein